MRNIACVILSSLWYTSSSRLRANVNRAVHSLLPELPLRPLPSRFPQMHAFSTSVVLAMDCPTVSPTLPNTRKATGIGRGQCLNGRCPVSSASPPSHPPLILSRSKTVFPYSILIFYFF